MPTLLAGADVDGEPNFTAAAWCGLANGEPPLICVAIRPQRYAHGGFTQKGTSSANAPSVVIGLRVRSPSKRGRTPSARMVGMRPPAVCSKTGMPMLKGNVVVQGKCQGLMFSDFVSRVNGTPL